MDIVDKLRDFDGEQLNGSVLQQEAADLIESLRAQLASAQAEKAELVKQCADIAVKHAKEATGQTGYVRPHIEALANELRGLIPKDNQEVNK
jgi:hypothetical protein